VAVSGCLGRVPRAPSIVFALVDQLRQDAANRWMPAVSALAARGTVCEEMRAVAPWTYPSVVSLMSGLLPQQHGADGNLHWDVLTTFDERVPLLHRRLRRAGYRTAAFITNPFLHDWNPFCRGFDHFDAHFVRNVGNTRGFNRATWVPEAMFGQSVNAAVFAFYRARRVTAPEFTYVHYIDVHGPWDGAPFAADYASAVAFTDARVSELYRFFAERYDEDLLFVVTSDHGVALDDDEHVGCGLPWRTSKLSVYDFNLRIPFAVLPARRVPAGVRISGSCSNIDVLPTLLDWLGMPARHAAPGVSLLPVARGRAAPDADRATYARVSAFRSKADGLVWRGRKYVRHFDIDDGTVSAHRVFDLAVDPREIAPLEHHEWGDASGLLEVAAGTHGVAYASRYDDMAPDLRQRLHVLGYLQ